MYAAELPGGGLPAPLTEFRGLSGLEDLKGGRAKELLRVHGREHLRQRAQQAGPAGQGSTACLFGALQNSMRAHTTHKETKR